MTVSPHLVNLIALSLLMLLPAVLTMAWVHGRPGRDSWGRLPKFVVPANVVTAGIMVFFLFQGRELGAVTQTVEVQDENGETSERIIPKSDFLRRVLIFYPENAGAAEDDRASEILALLVTIDISQDVFVDVTLPLTMPLAFKDAGSEDGHDLPRPLQRKLASDADIAFFLTGSLILDEGIWTLETELHESESGKVSARQTMTADDLFDLADAASLQLRRDLGIPSTHLEQNRDLPVVEMTSNDIEAVKSHVAALTAITLHNDWSGAVPLLVDATTRDPQFAASQFLLSAVYQTLGNQAGASTAITAAMDNLYRLPERMGFMVKTQYYYNEKQDADRAMAVLDMWVRLYPHDIDALSQQALYRKIRQDLIGAVASYERILDIDPSRIQILDDLADLYTQLGDHQKAERCLKRYVTVHPTRAEGYKDLADFYSGIGRLDDARDAIEQALLIEPEELDLRLRLIDLDAKDGHFEASRQRYTDELGEAETALNRARIQSRLSALAGITGRGEDQARALDAYYEAISEIQSPLQADLVFSMNLPALAEVGRHAEALTRIDELADRIAQPYAKLTGVSRAWVLTRLGRTDEARTALAEAREVVDTFKFETFRPSLALVGGMIDEAEGDLEAAVGLYQTAIDRAIQPDPMYRILLAGALIGLERHDEALETLRDALRPQPAHPGLHLEIARALHGKGDDDGARESLAKALSAWSGADAGFPPFMTALELDRTLRQGV